jgi:hypothetical protein
VDWIISGKPAESFDPYQKPLKTALAPIAEQDETNDQGTPKAAAKPLPKARTKPGLDTKKIIALAQKVEAAETPEDKTAAQEALDKYLTRNSSLSEPHPNKPGQKIYLVSDSLAGVNVIHKIQQKVAKGEIPTLMETMVLGGYRMGQGFGWIGKHILKPMFEPVWHKIKKILGKTFGWIFGILGTIVVLCALAWLVWNFLLHGFHPIYWMESKMESVFHHEQTAPVPTPEPAVLTQMSSIAPQVQSAVSHLIPKKKTEKPAPAVAYQPSVSFSTTASPLNSFGTLYDPKILESEIQSLPQDCIVKDYPLKPDEGIPGDLAVSRMQDMTDADKYTMKIGGGKQIILSVNATTTNLIVHYKSADALGGFLDNGGLTNVFWEDVKYIHTNEVDVETKNPYVLYQCSLVVSGAKNPLTIQCATAEDLEHLVSTMEYFIRTSRLGHDTALGGMPYPNQGLRFTGTENVTNLLWADSPADKAGLKLGDRLWSIGKVTNEQQSRSDIEKGLQTLPVTLFAVSPADWDNALLAKNTGAAKFLSPKMRKITF